MSIFLFFSLIFTSVTNTILVDNSGSMCCAYRSGNIQKIFRVLFQILDESPITDTIKVYTFNTSVNSVDESFSISCTEKNTDLVRALEFGAQSGAQIIWLLTDNLYDPRGFGIINNRPFYKELRKDSYSYIYLLPLRIKTYCIESDRLIKRMAIVLYSISLGKDRHEGDSILQYQEKAIESFMNVLADRYKNLGLAMAPSKNDVVLVKPLGANAVEANVELEKEGITKLEPSGGRGKKIRFSLKASLKPAESSLIIDTAQINVNGSDLLFSKNSLLEFEKGELLVVPNYYSKQGVEYSISISGYLRFKRGPALFKAIYRSRKFENAKLMVDITMIVPVRSIRFSKEFLKRWGTNDPTNREKLFQIDRIPSFIASHNAVIEKTRYFPLRIIYPGWLNFIFALGIILGVVVLYLFMIALDQKRRKEL